MSRDSREKLAQKFIDDVAPKVFEACEKAGIQYNDEMLCLAMEDGFIAGFDAALKQKIDRRDVMLILIGALTPDEDGSGYDVDHAHLQSIADEIMELTSHGAKK